MVRHTDCTNVIWYGGPHFIVVCICCCYVITNYWAAISKNTNKISEWNTNPQWIPFCFYFIWYQLLLCMKFFNWLCKSYVISGFEHLQTFSSLIRFDSHYEITMFSISSLEFWNEKDWPFLFIRFSNQNRLYGQLISEKHFSEESEMFFSGTDMVIVGCDLKTR